MKLAIILLILMTHFRMTNPLLPNVVNFKILKRTVIAKRNLILIDSYRNERKDSMAYFIIEQFINLHTTK